MWIESASDIYIILFYFENFEIFTNYFMILALFCLFSMSFYIIRCMDLQPWEAFLNSGVIYRNPIVHSKCNATSRPSAISSST